MFAAATRPVKATRATVFGIVDQSGGAISLTSRQGEGSTFIILLPRSDDDREAVATVGARAEALRGGAEQGIAAGDISFLQKPFSLLQLAQRVRGLLDDTSSGASSTT